MVGELGNVLEKVVKDFGKLFQRIGGAYFKRRCRGAEYSEMISRTSGERSFNIYKFSEVLGLRSMKVISERDVFVVDSLLYFEPVQTFESGMMCSVLNFSYCASMGNL